MRDKSQLAISAPAKLNLYLHVKGLMHNGYHELETVMQTVSLFDELRIREFAGTEIKLITGNSEGLPPAEENLVVKAAKLLKYHYPRVKTGVEIRLKKNIPPGTGLGGGSSDAAAALKGISKIWGLEMQKPELAELAAELGSDIPFFIYGGAAICRGRGELVEPLPDIQENFICVLALPPIHVSTAEVYSEFDCLTNKSSLVNIAEVVSSLKFGDTKMLGDNLFNNLRQAACNVSTRLAEVEETMDKFFSLSGAYGYNISGSGSAWFGVYSERESALQAVKNFKEQANIPACIVHPVF